MGEGERPPLQSARGNGTVAVRLRPGERHPVCSQVVQGVRGVLQIRAQGQAPSDQL